MVLVVTIPNTDVKMTETRKRRARNGVRKTVKRRKKTKKEGSMMYQSQRKEMGSPRYLLKIFLSHPPINFPNAELIR